VGAGRGKKGGAPTAGGGGGAVHPLLRFHGGPNLEKKGPGGGGNPPRKKKTPPGQAFQGATSQGGAGLGGRGEFLKPVLRAGGGTTPPGPGGMISPGR